MKKKLVAFSTLHKKLHMCVCVCVKKLGDLAVELGLNQSKFSLKSFSNLAIFPEVPGPKDAFNFFHSQVRINIDCAFGMFVHHWGMLQKPTVVNVSVKNASSLVCALCELHNCCVACDNKNVEPPADEDILNFAVENVLISGRFNILGHFELCS